MRKLICMVLVGIMVMASGMALAEGETDAAQPAKEAKFSAKGSVKAPNPVSVLAPMGGQAEDFSWVTGDVADANALAFSIRPTQVLAANDGVIRSLRAEVGDRAEDVIAQYGALCYIERQDVWRIEGTTSTAYSDPDNRDVRIGQLVRVQHGTGDDKVRGEATVIAVNGKDITLELEQGDFEIEDSVKMYFDTSKDNADKDRVGSGTIIRADAIGVTGGGVVAQVLVSEGQEVKRGQALFTLDGPSARYEDGRSVSGEVRFPEAGLIAEVLVRPGEFVEQGQAVMTLIPTGELEATLEVDELDISKVRVGDTVRVRVDAYQQERTGAVKEIRQLGQTVLDTTKYLVKVGFEKSDDLMIGMHVTGYWD